jgi:hypothetical protein
LGRWLPSNTAASWHQVVAGHHLPLAVTFRFFTLSESKRLLFGDEIGTQFGSTQPEAVFQETVQYRTSALSVLMWIDDETGIKLSQCH